MFDQSFPRLPAALAFNPPRTKLSLPEESQILVEWFQQMYFGIVEDLHVKNGLAILTPAPRLLQHFKFPSEPIQRLELESPNFQLKSQHLAFFQKLADVGNGVVAWVEVRHGLPFRACVNRSEWASSSRLTN